MVGQIFKHDITWFGIRNKGQVVYMTEEHILCYREHALTDPQRPQACQAASSPEGCVQTGEEASPLVIISISHSFEAIM